MRNVPRPTRRTDLQGETIATWRHPRRQGDIDMRATHTGGRIVIAERHGHRWQVKRDVPADPTTLAKLRRQGRR